MRPKALTCLLESLGNQTLYPNEVLIIDGSVNDHTKKTLERHTYKNLSYFLVGDKDRGLTKQRNFGISKVDEKADIICFLDDDTVLEPDYFTQIVRTYNDNKEAIGVGGYITNDTVWSKKGNSVGYNDFAKDGFVRKLGKRYIIRKKFGLMPDAPPGFVPSFSNGYPISFLPPTGNTYRVECFMGCAMSFKKTVFDKIYFSTYFDGYGLYEDLDFCLRASKLGRLYVNTQAQLEHFHELAGRPNKYKYGRMVVRNGWYVWRTKYHKVKFKPYIKFHLITLLLLGILLTNAFHGQNKTQSFTEALGRFSGWMSLFFNKPIKR